MARFAAIATVLLCVAFPSSAVSVPSTKEIEVDGVLLQYVDQGSGEPVVFVHGCCSDLRVWGPVGEEIAKRYRFIALTQRYFGTAPWKDDGKEFGVATLADDLARFITSLDTGPVHLVAWSFGGQVATTAAVENPSLFRSLILYEATIFSVLPTGSAAEKAAREDRGRMVAPAIAANKAGDPAKAIRVLMESVFQLPPGGSDREPQALQAMWEDNARTIPLLFAAPPPPAITCDMLGTWTRATLVMRGERTQSSYALVSDAISKCVPGAQQVVLPKVNHDGPARDPAGFSAAVLEFLSKQ